MALLLVAVCAMSGCGSDSEEVAPDGGVSSDGSGAPVPLRVYEHPYSEVDWASDLRLKAQHHDHVAWRATTRLAAYDNAGYDVVSLMDYSGKQGAAWALAERPWPPEDWVPQSTLTQLARIRFLIPNAEEVGINRHATSPFLTTYIEGAGEGVQKESWQYDSLAEEFALIRAYGGFPCIAHPWDGEYHDVSGTFCAEIYTAYAEAQRLLGRDGYVLQDRNVSLLENWDRALQRNQRIFGIAVNDHYGPYVTDEALVSVRDSGKIIVLTKAATFEAYRSSFEKGALLAVRDRGAIKDRYPLVSSIVVDESSVTIEAEGVVRWITNGRIVGTGSRFAYSMLPPNVRYLRAEIEGESGSTVYTQAFAIRQIGDVDGDHDVDETDIRICENAESDPQYLAPVLLACRAIRG